jgi:hypothetical protein
MLWHTLAHKAKGAAHQLALEMRVCADICELRDTGQSDTCFYKNRFPKTDPAINAKAIVTPYSRRSQFKRANKDRPL